MIKDHKTNREKVENETWEEIEQIKERNKEQLAREIDQGMKQRSDLKLIKNEQHLKDSEKRKLDSQIAEQNTQLQEEIQNTNREKSIIESLKNELHERQLTIADKDEKIEKLRKQV